MNGGERIARVLAASGVKVIFTLCGGHISPILVGAKSLGIRVVDTRHEVNAVFAADAMARLTGIPGVAAVTAGPGVTNALTAIKNAQLAQSPIVVFGGATAGLLRGRGSLQDIDQHELVRPHVKAFLRPSNVGSLDTATADALAIAASGVPGPVFIECPVDLLYPEELVRSWFASKSSKSSIRDRLFAWYLGRYADRIFSGAGDEPDAPGRAIRRLDPSAREIARIALQLARAERPLMIVGSQAVHPAGEARDVAEAVERLGIPVYLTGMSRGLLGRDHPLQIRHRRRDALKASDLVVLVGVPCDFRLDYGRQIGRRTLIGINRSRRDLTLNRRPDVAVLAEPGRALRALAERVTPRDRRAWIETLRQGDSAREGEIEATAAEPVDGVNPLALCRAIENALDDDSILVADGGDFVSTASYIVRPRGPLSWLDPGAFGTLGVGAGFAMAAKLARPGAEVWILYGDGSAGFSIAEFDSFVRHRIPVIAVVGNDGCWTQIAREQVDVLGDDTACMLGQSSYHAVAEGFGAAGILVREPSEVDGAIANAKAIACEGRPVLVDIRIGSTDFRKGSISI